MDYQYVTKELVPHVIYCTRELYGHSTPTSADRWIYVTNEVLYYIFPLILTVGVVFSMINTLVTAKMATDSHECYLTTFNLCSCFMLLSVCIFQLPNYVQHPATEYKKLLPYMPGIESWFWYCCTWLLTTIIVERSLHALCGKWHSSFGKIHGSLVSFLVVVVCFVSTLPQYWEYKLGYVNDLHGNHNCTKELVVPNKGVLEKSRYIEGYKWFHWYEMIVGIGLPYLIIPFAILPLVCVKMHIYTSLPPNDGKSSTSYNGSSVKDQLRQEKSFNKLIFTVAILYLIMSGPRNVLRLMHNPPISVPVTNDDVLLAVLKVLFDVLFYVFFSCLFFLYLAFGKKFRTTLYRLCCCKRTDSVDYDYY